MDIEDKKGIQMDIKFRFYICYIVNISAEILEFLWTNSEYLTKIKKTKIKWTNLLYFSVEVLLFRLFSNCWELLFLHINIYTIPVLCISKVRWTIKIRNLYFFLWNFSLFLALIDVVCTCPPKRGSYLLSKMPYTNVYLPYLQNGDKFKSSFFLPECSYLPLTLLYYFETRQDPNNCFFRMKERQLFWEPWKKNLTVRVRK